MFFFICLLCMAPVVWWVWRALQTASNSALTTLLDWPGNDQATFMKREGRS